MYFSDQPVVICLGPRLDYLILQMPLLSQSHFSSFFLCCLPLTATQIILQFITLTGVFFSFKRGPKGRNQAAKSLRVFFFVFFLGNSISWFLEAVCMLPVKTP